jgi:predicted metal-dependent hydrolase
VTTTAQDAVAKTPIDIAVRHMGFSFPDDLPRYWVSNDPFETHLFNGLSLTFPLGEKQFVDSVRAYANQITDPALADDVRAFIGQEMQHSREHETFNAWIEKQGLPADYIYAYIRERIEKSKVELPQKTQLAITCALEHFTAIMASVILEDPDFFASVDERVRMLWLWHAIEETEHKAVAFDVFQHVGGSYRTRALTMVFVTTQFIWNQAHFHRTLMHADGQSLNVKSWARGIARYWGPRGKFTKLIPAYLDYYRRDFHPWQHDNRELVAKWKRLIEENAKRVVPQAGKAGQTIPRAA